MSEAGFEAPLHASLVKPLLMGGAPRTVAIVNGTLATALALGLQLWALGILLGVAGHALAVWAAKRDPQFLDVIGRHLKHRAFLDV